MSIDRRRFLAQSSAITLGSLPLFVYRGANAAGISDTNPDGKILVVVQMSGGNDGINTVVPFADEGYAKHRKKLRLPADRLIKLNDSVALNPSMRSAADLLEDGRLAIVQGVSYPNPSRSHDTSMAIWHSAQIGDEDTVRAQGWLGRAMDDIKDETNSVANDDPQIILLGNETQPLAIQSRRSKAISLAEISDLRLTNPSNFAKAAKSTSRTTNDLNRFVEKTMQNATVAAKSLTQFSDQPKDAGAAYPATKLSQRLRSVAALIKSGFKTPVYYTIQAGYDTHSAQLRTHGRLLREFSGAIKAFLDDLKAAGLSDRVCVMGFSEFGRRVEENGSKGTDHGTAGPVFLAGDHVKSGLIGKTPNLLELVDGDLPMEVDFRDIYRSVTTDWLGLKSDSAESSPAFSLKLFDM